MPVRCDHRTPQSCHLSFDIRSTYLTRSVALLAALSVVEGGPRSAIISDILQSNRTQGAPSVYFLVFIFVRELLTMIQVKFCSFRCHNGSRIQNNLKKWHTPPLWSNNAKRYMKKKDVELLRGWKIATVFLIRSWLTTRDPNQTECGSGKKHG